ncbi:hypothetical protein PIB30_009793 [Stylosanthes scabra]|uniref:DUF4283 domain-containing protein n=1 Tax=Stylosanthes scabra TaxID=79078 RepID=A0ABU6Y727_9FABA|nr:hypothetical protein [Stylosanthes scabra]
MPECRTERMNDSLNVKINEAALKDMRYPMWYTLIVKLLGRKISFPVISRSYLVLEADFNLMEATIDSIVAWVRLPVGHGMSNCPKKGEQIGSTSKIVEAGEESNKGETASNGGDTGMNGNIEKSNDKAVICGSDS